MLLLALFPIVYWSVYHLNQDLWWDELVSLQDYILVDYEITKTNYTEPNNHIFFNLVNNFYTRLINIRDLYEILDHVHILRLLQLLLSLATILYSYLIVKNFFYKKHAFITPFIIATCIPFINFSLQLRGYNMSMLFMIMTIYYTWSYIESRKLYKLVIQIMSVFLLLYTIPSNIYVLFAFSVTIIWVWLKQRSSKDPDYDRVTYRNLFIAGIIAAILTLIAYQSIINDVLHNRFVDKKPDERFFVLFNQFPTVTYFFLSERWLIIPIILVGLWIKAKKRLKLPNQNKFNSLVIIFILPFILLFLHNKEPFQRTFIVLIPIFSILLSILIINAISNIKTSGKIKTISLVSICIYTLVAFVFYSEKNENILVNNLEKNIREQNIYRNYYLSKLYTPHDAAKKIKTYSKNPVAFYVDELDKVAIVRYLEKYNVENYFIPRIRQQNVTVKNQNYNHIALVQVSDSDYKNLKYMNIPCQLPVGNKFNKHRLMMTLISNVNKPDNSFLLTGFHEKMRQFINQEKKSNFNLIDSSSYLQIYKVTPK